MQQDNQSSRTKRVAKNTFLLYESTYKKCLREK